MPGRNDGQSGSESTRPKYRDNDDQRAYLSGSDRNETKPESRNEAKGTARETVGDNTRGTDAHPTGPEGNDRTRLRPQSDEFDADLSDDSERRR